MSFKVHQFPSGNELSNFLSGALVGGVDFLDRKQYIPTAVPASSPPKTAGKLYGLHGLTLIINGSTTTFSDASSAGLSFAEVATAIEGAVSGLSVTWQGGRPVFTHATGVTLDKDGTANAIFGFTSQQDIVTQAYAAPDGAAPRWLQVGFAVTGGGFFVVVELED